MNRFALLLALLLVAVPVGAHAQITWTGGTSGSWGTASNWSSGSVPSSTDIVELDNGPGSNYTVRIDLNNQSIDSLAITSSNATLEVQSGYTLTTNNGYRQAQGTLTGAGTVNVGGTLVWSGGTMSGSGTTEASGGFEIPGDVRLDARRFVLSVGTGVFNASNTTYFLTGANGAVLEIQSGTTFEDTDFSDMDVATPGDPPTLINRGTLRKTGGARTDIDWQLRNEGTVEVLTTDGSFRLNGQIISSSGTPGVAEGTFRAIDSPLEFRPASDLTFASGSVVEGDTTLQFGSSVVDPTEIRVEGELDVRDDLQVAGNGDTTSVEIRSGATLTELGADIARIVDAGSLRVNTTDPITIGELRVGNGSHVTVSSELTVQERASFGFNSAGFTSGSPFNVEGLLEWNGGAIAGAGVIRADGGFDIGGNVLLDNRRLLIPTGQVGTFSASNTTHFLTGANGAVLEVESGAVFEDTDFSDLDVATPGDPPTLINRGTIQKTAGARTDIAWPLQNEGIVEVLTSDGPLRIGGQIISSGGTPGVAEGTFRAIDSPLQFRPASSLTFSTGSVVEGDTTLQFGSSVVDPTEIRIEGELDARDDLQVGGTGDTTSVEIRSGATLTELGADAVHVVDVGSLRVNTTDPVTIGELQLGNGGHVTVNSELTVGGGALFEFNSAGFASSSDLIVQGLLDWRGGTIAGSGTLRAEGGFNIRRNVTLDTRRLLLPTGETGVFSASNTNHFLTGANGAVLEIQNGATFEDADFSDLDVSTPGDPPRIINRGTFVKTGGAATVVDWEVQSTGSIGVDVSGETLQLSGSLLDGTGTTGRIEGMYQATNGTLQLSPPVDTVEVASAGGVAVGASGTVEANVSLVGSGSFNVAGQLYAERPIFAEGGTVSLTGSGELLRGTPGSLVADTALVLRSGTLQGTGTVTGDLFANGGVVRPGGDGAAGTMTVSGVYKQSGGARLNAELGGATGGTDYDSLSVNEATLAGELRLEQLNDFNPTTADTLRPVVWSGGVRNGQFDQVAGRSTFDSPLKVQYDDAENNALEVAGKILPGRDVEPTSLSDTLVFSKARTRSLTIENTETETDAENLEAMIQAQDNPSWLSVSPTSVSIPPGGTATVDVQLSARRTSPGTYRDTIEITDPELDGALPVPVQFTITRPRITLRPSPQVASPGTKVDIEIGIPETITPKSGSLAYRPAGDEAFQFVSLDENANVSELADNTSQTLTTSVPGSAVTKRGVQYYVPLTSQDTTGSVPINTPVGAPTRPAFVPVEFQEIQAEGTFEPERYRMLTVPVAGLGDRSVFDVLTEQYGDYNPSLWRFARWAPSQSAYREGPDVDSLTPGQAAWLIIKQGAPLTITEGGRSVEASEPHSIVLQPGWNQIGNPFGFAVPWDTVQAASDLAPSDVDGPVAYRPPGDNESEGRFVDNQSELVPWTGYFLFNAQSEPDTLVVPPVGTASASQSKMIGTSGRRQAQRVMKGKANSGKRYTLRVEAASASERETVHLGVWPEAKTGRDQWDFAKTPSIRGTLQLSAQETVGGRTVSHAGSFKPTGASGQSWRLTLSHRASEGGKGASAKTVRLSVRAEGTPPPDQQRYILDLEAKRRLIPGEEISMDAGDRRNLKVIVGTKSYVKNNSKGISLELKNELRANYPNPFSEATTLEYVLKEARPVTIEIYNVLGQHIRTLVDQKKEAGRHKVHWDGKNRFGTPVGSGVYFYRIEAGDFTASKKMVRVR